MICGRAGFDQKKANVRSQPQPWIDHGSLARVPRDMDKYGQRRAIPIICREYGCFGHEAYFAAETLGNFLIVNQRHAAMLPTPFGLTRAGSFFLLQQTLWHLLPHARFRYRAPSD